MCDPRVRRHWVDVTAFHFVQDGRCSFVVFPPEQKAAEASEDGEASEAATDSASKAASVPVRLTCTKGAVVVLVSGLAHVCSSAAVL